LIQIDHDRRVVTPGGGDKMLDLRSVVCDGLARPAALAEAATTDPLRRSQTGGGQSAASRSYWESMLRQIVVVIVVAVEDSLPRMRLLNVPRRSWPGELAQHPRQRNRDQ
jgi:hypothetical protein